MRAANFYSKPAKLAHHRRYVEKLRHRTKNYSLKLCFTGYDRHHNKQLISRLRQRLQAKAQWKQQHKDLEERLDEWEDNRESRRLVSRRRSGRKGWLEDECEPVLAFNLT